MDVQEQTGTTIEAQSSSVTEEPGEEPDTDIVYSEAVPGWKLHADDKVSFDWYINYSWFTTPWGENLVSKKITEETGIDIHFVTPMGNESEKLNVLIASDTLPDIVTLGWWESQVDEMIEKDMVYALNELADQYDAYFWQVADPQILSWNTNEDGNIYVYPNSSYSPEDFEKRDDIGSNQTFLVRKDIYEAIGSPDMSTQEGFQNAVRKAVELFPEVDGEPLIPIGAHEFTNAGCVSFDQYLQNFLAVPYEKDGRIYDRYTDEEYLSWLKTFRQLGSEGYLSRDIFIDQRRQMEEKLSKGRYFCMIFQRTDMEAQQKELYQEHPERIYIAVDGPRNSHKDDPVLPGSGINGWTVTLISKNCQRPDRAIELLSYFLSEEGQKMIYLGVEGITYDMVDGVPVMNEEVQQLLDTNRAEYDRLYGADNAYWMLQDNAMQLEWRRAPVGPVGDLEVWTYPYTHYLGQYEINYGGNDEAAKADTAINKLWSQMLPKLLLAESDEEFERLVKQFKRERLQLNYGAWLEESTKQIAENKRKLGMN
ncbi:MAG: extracellular solute-binding protein [Lachnospiraceae bacterium]|nr:extracellular solute-binding protein [Lachnospiraceae bacterium]